MGASFLQLNEVRDACADFLISRFHSHNVLGIRQFADSMGCMQLVSAAEKYIHHYFSKVSDSDEFYNLGKCYLTTLDLYIQSNQRCHTHRTGRTHRFDSPRRTERTHRRAHFRCVHEMDQIQGQPIGPVATGAGQNSIAIVDAPISGRSCGHRGSHTYVASVSRFAGRSKRFPFDARTSCIDTELSNAAAIL